MLDIWSVSILIILITLLTLLFLRKHEYTFSKDSQYLASAIGLSGFIVAAMGDGLFIH